MGAKEDDVKDEPMLSPPLVYRLAFRATDLTRGELRRKAPVPALICAVPDTYAPYVDEGLAAARNEEYSIPDAEGVFGYGKCARRSASEGETIYALGYTAAAAEEVAATASILLEVLNTVTYLRLYGTLKGGNPRQRQFLEARVTSYSGSGVDRYSVGGRVYQKMKCWLSLVSSGLTEPKQVYSRDSFQGFAVAELKGVCEAMKKAWRSTASPDLVKDAAACRAGIAPSGRFSLVCFGNSCDVSIYPDQMGHADKTIKRVGYPVEFGCHNVDGPTQ